MILDLFKIGIFSVDLNLDVKSISDYCQEYRKNDVTPNTPGTLSNSGGYHSSYLQGKHLPLNTLFQKITEHANVYSQALGFSNTRKISDIWININGYRDYNIEHSHSGCILSGVYYAQTPKNCGNIIFYPPHIDVLQANWYREEKNSLYNYSNFWVPSIANRLYLFPNWLRHGVESNMNKYREERISLSFNVI